jgi:hypothetical protein
MDDEFVEAPPRPPDAPTYSEPVVIVGIQEGPDGKWRTFRPYLLRPDGATEPAFPIGGRDLPMINVQPLRDRVDLLFRDAEPGILEDIRDVLANAPSGFLTEFFSQFIKPSYVSMDGAVQHRIGLSFGFPRRADELLAALRAYKRKKDFVSHG